MQEKFPMDGTPAETGRRALFILFSYHTAFHDCDTECQIKRPHARGSMSDLFQKQLYASFFSVSGAAPSSAAAASRLHTDGAEFCPRTFRYSSAFPDTALVLVSPLTGWRAREPR